MVKVVTARFDDVSGARGAARAMRSAGFLPNDVHVDAGLLRADVARTSPNLDPSEGALGVATGILCGGAIGATAGLALTLLEIEFPGLAAIVAVGKIAPALAGAGVGCAFGALVGGLRDQATMPKASGSHTARHAAATVEVSTDPSRVAEAERIMRLHGGCIVEGRVQQWTRRRDA